MYQRQASATRHVEVTVRSGHKRTHSAWFFCTLKLHWAWHFPTLKPTMKSHLISSSVSGAWWQFSWRLHTWNMAFTHSSTSLSWLAPQLWIHHNKWFVRWRHQGRISRCPWRTPGAANNLPRDRWRCQISYWWSICRKRTGQKIIHRYRKVLCYLC